MNAFLRLLTDIALLRRGPQDLPFSPGLLAATIVGYVSVSELMSRLFPVAVDSGFGQVLVDSAVTLVWTWGVFQLLKRRERFVQTSTALFGYQMLLAPAVIPVRWLIDRFKDDPPFLLPVWIVFAALLVWALVINVHILRAALEWSIAACVGLVLAQAFLTLFLLNLLFPAPPGAGT